jgi:hypothetical protein
MNGSAKAPLLAWPGWPHLKFACLLMLLVTAWFCCVYWGTDWFTAHRLMRVRVHFGAELLIPLIPSFTLIYMSIYPIFLAAPFVLRTRPELTSLAAAQTITILVAGICFLLIPAKLAFPVATDAELGVWKSLFRFADRINLDYNLVPSLHVALSVVCVEMFAIHATVTGKRLLRLWGALIAISTVVTHQHHVVDAATGNVLALVVVKAVGAYHRKPLPALVTPTLEIPEAS